MVSETFGKFGHMMCEEGWVTGIIHLAERKVEGGSGGMWLFVDGGL